MKTFARIFTALIATAFFATGCVNEDPNYTKTDPEPKPGTTGFLSTQNLSMRVVVDTDTSESDTAKEAGTRAVPAINDFIIEILNSSNVSVYNKTYGEFSATESLELPVGTYTLNVRSEENIPDVAWEHPVYGCSRTFSIVKAQTTDIGEVVCTLKNIKVTVLVSADLAAELTDETAATVALGNSEMDFVMGETRALYFKSLAENNTLEFLLSGKFESVGGQPEKPVQFSKTIENVKAGQWRKITLVITWSDKGEIKFDIVVESLIQDEEVVVNAGAWLSEAIYDDSQEVDENAPKIIWVDHDISQTFQLKKTMFNEDGDCLVPFTFNLTSPNGIESMVVSISSTNTEFMTSLSEMLPSSFDLCALTPADGMVYSVLKSMGFPVGSELKGKTAKSFDITNQMGMLYGYDGTHTFSFSMTDTKGLTANAALRLLVDKANESTSPTIVWRGHNIDQAYNVYAGMDVDIDVTSPTGIQKFEVTISYAISDDLLEAIHLARTFDLCNITDPQMLATISTPIDQGGLGFPVNDEVRGKTSLALSISYFANLLLGIPGNHDFVLTVTDENSSATTKTVKLVSQP